LEHDRREAVAIRCAPPVVAPGKRDSDAIYSLSAVSYAVDCHPLLHPIDLELSAHRVHGLIGHNGSGKSTLIKLLARQQPATSGTILFEGQRLAAWSDRAFARKVGYLPQQLPPAPGMLVRELVALGRYPWHGALGRFGAGDREKVDAAMRMTDVVGLADRLVDSLSGGERQRAWIALLVAQDSECLLLDEPISALDIAHQIEILTLIRKLSRQRRLSVAVVLHDVNMAARFCDELVALRGGKLLMRGTPDDLMQPKRLAAIYGLPMGILAHPRSGAPLGFPW
jgi:iron complex transport system ATP-binding protein